MNTEVLYNEIYKEIKQKEYIVLSIKDSKSVDTEATEILDTVTDTELEEKVIKLFIRFGYKVVAI